MHRRPHPNLSAELNAAVRAGDENLGINIDAQEKGTMIEVITDHHKYTLVVIDPEKHEVAMTTDNLEIDGYGIWTLLGAGWGGSMTQIGRIVVGAHMKMRQLTGGVTETSRVKSFLLKN